MELAFDIIVYITGKLSFVLLPSVSLEISRIGITGL